MLDNRSEAFRKSKKVEEVKSKSPTPNLIVPFNKDSPTRVVKQNEETEITPVKEALTHKPQTK